MEQIMPLVTPIEQAKLLTEEYLGNLSLELEEIKNNKIQPELMVLKLEAIANFNILIKTDHSFIFVNSISQLQQIRETILSEEHIHGLIIGGVSFVLGIMGIQRWNDAMRQYAEAVYLSQQGLAFEVIDPQQKNQFIDMVFNNPWYGFCLLMRLTVHISEDE